MAVCPHCDGQLENASQKDCGNCGKDAHTVCEDPSGCLCMKTKCDNCYKSEDSNCDCLKCPECGTKAENQSQKACDNCQTDFR